jgi:integrase
MATGITKRHSKGCPGRDGGRCRCNAGWEASVFSKRDGKKIRRTFARESEAKSWRADALHALARGGLRAPKPTTVREAWDEWYEGAKGGGVRNRSGDRYKPSSLRDYERNMRVRVLPELGAVRLTDLRRPDLQEFADRLLATKLDPSTIRTTFLPLRAIYRRAVARGEVAANPCAGLELPAVRGRRERFASPAEAEALIAAVPAADRAVWATAMYAGLRLGELRALRMADVDLAAGVIRVERGYDAVEGEIELKSGAGRRRVPIAAVLRDYLSEQVARTGRAGADRCFGTTGVQPFDPQKLQARADKAWRDTGLERITPHECRHTFASLMIAAGVNAKALQTFMGHSNVTTTLDVYGHLMPGSEDEAAGLLDDYLTVQREQAEDAARAAGGVATGAPAGAPVAHGA